MPPESNPTSEEDEVRLRHMLDAARMIHEFVKNRQRGDLSLEHLDTLGIVKCLENIGEAANQLDDSTLAMMPGVPWPRVIAMRHRLVHEYFEIDLDRVWVTATTHVLPLIAAIERVLHTH
jgi:uncharacterized protein with HEPN domain